MKRFLPILILVCLVYALVWAKPQSLAAQESSPSASGPVTAPSGPAIPLDQENARKAKAVIDQGIQALGGQTFLTIRDREQQGRGYSFHHGRPTGGGGVFWSFTEFPDKERVEITKERDIAELYVGNQRDLGRRMLRRNGEAFVQQHDAGIIDPDHADQCKR